VIVQITDLKHSGLELQVESKDWIRLLAILLGERVIDGPWLFHAGGNSRIEVSVEMARKIGAHLERKFLNDLRESRTPPAIPDYLRPIATSNGLWIDPALPLLNRPDQDYFYLRFATFCMVCSGFSIGQ
jgi:hypothetical protein